MGRRVVGEIGLMGLHWVGCERGVVGSGGPSMAGVVIRGTRGALVHMSPFEWRHRQQFYYLLWRFLDAEGLLGLEVDGSAFMLGAVGHQFQCVHVDEDWLVVILVGEFKNVHGFSPWLWFSFLLVG